MAGGDGGAGVAAMTTTLPTPKEKTDEHVKTQPPYNVILLNDDDHTFEYVITMLQELFGHPVETGYQMAVEVHTKGRAIVDTTTRGTAGLTPDPIHAHRPAPLINPSNGSTFAESAP